MAFASELYVHRGRQRTMCMLKPNSWTYNLVEVPGIILRVLRLRFLCIQCLYYKPVSNHLYGYRCTQLPHIEKLLQWLLGPSPSLPVASDRPRVTGPDSNDVRTRSIYSTISVDDINGKSGWSLKTERIRLKWHVYIDTTHTIRHLFLKWTSLYPFTFLATQLKHMRHFRLLFFNFWLALLPELYSGTYLPG